MPTKTRRDWLEPPTWWKKWRPLRIVALGIIGASVLSTTWTVKKYVLPPTPHPLTELYTTTSLPKITLGDFQSYDSVESVRDSLTKEGYEFTEQPLHTPFSELYPPHDLDTVTVGKYKHLGAEGLLNLEFFNNRLYEVEFVPKESASYVSTLRREFPDLKRDHIGDALLVSGNLRVSSNVDLVHSDVGQTLRVHPFVIWQDLRLTRQRDQWDHDYSAINPNP